MNEKNMIKIMEFNQVEQTIEILGHKIDKSYESWEAFLEEMKRLTLVQNNWNELKKQLEEYKATNKVLSQELTKDKVLQQDHLTTCCGIPIGDIPKLITQQKEFIKYMNDIIKELEAEDVNDVQKAIKELQQENKKLNGAIQTYDILLKTNVEENKQLKEVIEEVREFVGSEEMYNCSFEEETNKLLQLLDKAKK